MERCDWSVDQCLFTNIERSVVDVHFRKFISKVKVLTLLLSKEKFSKFLFRNSILKLISNVKGGLELVLILNYIQATVG